MNIASALKVKNRLAGKLAKLRESAQENNSYTSINPSPVDLTAVWLEMQKTYNELVELKSKISRATNGICHKLVELSELKGMISFYQDLNIINGKGSLTVNGGTVEWFERLNFCGTMRRDSAIAEVQEKIDALQDEVDEYNAKTII